MERRTLGRDPVSGQLEVSADRFGGEPGGRAEHHLDIGHALGALSRHQLDGLVHEAPRGSHLVHRFSSSNHPRPVRRDDAGATHRAR
jgi:hypothetical protein